MCRQHRKAVTCEAGSGRTVCVIIGKCPRGWIVIAAALRPERRPARWRKHFERIAVEFGAVCGSGTSAMVRPERRMVPMPNEAPSHHAQYVGAQNVGRRVLAHADDHRNAVPDRERGRGGCATKDARILRPLSNSPKRCDWPNSMVRQWAPSGASPSAGAWCATISLGSSGWYRARRPASRIVPARCVPPIWAGRAGIERDDMHAVDQRGHGRRAHRDRGLDPACPRRSPARVSWLPSA